MAETPSIRLVFTGGCGDCGERRVDLPDPLPAIPDDFDWAARDYDSFRLFLMEELAARAPERTRWTPADMEVVLVELLAAALDRLSHALDSIQQERFLETARRPESVRRLLQMIGYDAVRHADPAKLAALPAVPEPESPAARLERLWRRDPQAMEAARRAGPRAIRQQERMVTLDDHRRRVAAHPLVARARATADWSGSWHVIRVAVRPVRGLALESPLDSLGDKLKAAVDGFHRARGLPVPAAGAGARVRDALAGLVESDRMAGRPVVLESAAGVGVTFAMSVKVRASYYRSEVVSALRAAFGSGPDGFFAPERLRFGEDLHASDLIEVADAIEGVETVCLNRFKRVGRRYPDRTDAGVIPIAADEIAVCANDPRQPVEGYFRLTAHGGIAG